jgi:hypothetical protein
MPYLTYFWEQRAQVAAPFIYKIQLYTLSINFDKFPVFSKQITGKFSQILENKSPQFRDLVEREFKKKFW